ncbi:la-related protein 6-like [Tubulanus polymorphus]|uniref:la-related protein 6-like n=1 Tax=Tubulanus polymorphus TaxID=672921 RepID=UPI003DA6C658
MSEVSGETSVKMASNNEETFKNLVTSGAGESGAAMTHSHESHDNAANNDDASALATVSDSEKAVIKERSPDQAHHSNKKTTIMAPVLRVEQHEDGVVESSVYYDNEIPTSHEVEVSPSVSDQESIQSDHSAKKDVKQKILPELVLPDEETRDKIIAQVEFYFSDENILKDAFLLKHVRRNRQGYVNIKLITSFKRVKSLSKDYRVVAYSLGFSSKLSVNEEGTKVCRNQPLPEFDETTPSRTVVVVNLPLENPTIESVAEIFKNCGEIALVRILRPGKTIPGDIKKHSNKHPEIGQTMCAVVEFEQHDSANEACKMTVEGNDMRVALLAAKQPKKEKTPNNNKLVAKPNHGKKIRIPTKELDARSNEFRPGYKWRDGNRSDSSDKSEGKPAKKVLEKPKINKPDGDKSDSDAESKLAGWKDVPASGKRNKNNKKRWNKDHLTEADVTCSSGSEIEMSSSPSERDNNWRCSLSPGKPVDRNHLSPASTPASSPRGSPRSSPGQKRKTMPQKSPLAAEGGLSPRQSPKPSPLSSPESIRRNRADSNEAVSPGGSPWVQRRLKAAKEISPLVSAISPSGSPLIQRKGLDDTARITRQPRGPDGTRGFAFGRGKPLLTVEAS